MPAADLLAAGTAALEFCTEPRYVSPSGQANPATEMQDEWDQAQEAGRRYFIKRPRLTRLLDACTSRIIMLVAPAGYGKTTLAREWLEDQTYAWYRGTPASADVAALAVGLAASVQPLLPGAGERMQERLRATGTPEKDVQPLAELLAEDLADWPAEAWIAVDDYQFACDSSFAERFIDLLCELAPIRLLLTSRVRPAWATARRILYGELHELGQNVLAMDGDEALAVLGSHKGLEASGLVALAQGWPAVIGLAALAEDFEPPEGELPDTLYEYFADELYQAVAPELRHGLCQLALAPSLTAELAAALLGEAGSTVTAEGIRLGLLTSPAKGVFEVHPLLRAFLEEKFRERGPEETAAVTSELVNLLVARGQWDDAFGLVERFFSDELFSSLLEMALSSLLSEGRLPTLTRWIDLGQSHENDSPVLDLAEAETAFGQGDRSKAETLALRAAKQLGAAHQLSSRAYWLAGTSAYLSERREDAFEHHSRAFQVAHSDTDRRAAASGRVVVASKLERNDAESLVAELAELCDDSPDSELRLLAAHVTCHTRMGLGDTATLLAQYKTTLHVLPKVRDPVARTSFFYSYAQLLCWAGRYREASAVADQTAAEARRTKLDFVIPHFYRVKLIAETGVHNFRRAASLLERLEAAGTELDETYLSIEAQTLRARLFLAQRLFDRARLPERLRQATPAPGEVGEFMAWQSLVLACSGNREEGLELAERAESQTRSSEVRSVAAFVRAIAALTEGHKRGQHLVDAAFKCVLGNGDIDAFVTAYRAYPPLLSVLSQTPEWQRHLAVIVGQARDGALVKSLGLPIDVLDARSSSPLSPREREIHELLAEGLSNGEIAKHLYISPATVKVHVRHIFDKLGVKTRVQAALLAATQENDQATSAKGSPE